MRAQAQRKQIASRRDSRRTIAPLPHESSYPLKGHPFFGFRHRLPRHSYHAVTASAELPTLIVKVGSCEDQRAAGSDHPP